MGQRLIASLLVSSLLLGTVPPVPAAASPSGHNSAAIADQFSSQALSVRAAGFSLHSPARLLMIALCSVYLTQGQTPESLSRHIQDALDTYEAQSADIEQQQEAFRRLIPAGKAGLPTFWWLMPRGANPSFKQIESARRLDPDHFVEPALEALQNPKVEARVKERLISEIGIVYLGQPPNSETLERLRTARREIKPQNVSNMMLGLTILFGGEQDIRDLTLLSQRSQYAYTDILTVWEGIFGDPLQWQSRSFDLIMGKFLGSELDLNLQRYIWSKVAAADPDGGLARALQSLRVPSLRFEALFLLSRHNEWIRSPEQIEVLANVANLVKDDRQKRIIEEIVGFPAMPIERKLRFWEILLSITSSKDWRNDAFHALSWFEQEGHSKAGELIRTYGLLQDESAATLGASEPVHDSIVRMRELGPSPAVALPDSSWSLALALALSMLPGVILMGVFGRTSVPDLQVSHLPLVVQRCLLAIRHRIQDPATPLTSAQRLSAHEQLAGIASRFFDGPVATTPLIVGLSKQLDEGGHSDNYLGYLVGKLYTLASLHKHMHGEQASQNIIDIQIFKNQEGSLIVRDSDTLELIISNENGVRSLSGLSAASNFKPEEQALAEQLENAILVLMELQSLGAPQAGVSRDWRVSAVMSAARYLGALTQDASQEYSRNSPSRGWVMGLVLASALWLWPVRVVAQTFPSDAPSAATASFRIEKAMEQLESYAKEKKRIPFENERLALAHLKWAGSLAVPYVQWLFERGIAFPELAHIWAQGDPKGFPSAALSLYFSPQTPDYAAWQLQQEIDYFAANSNDIRQWLPIYDSMAAARPELRQSIDAFLLAYGTEEHFEAILQRSRANPEYFVRLIDNALRANYEKAIPRVRRIAMRLVHPSLNGIEWLELSPYLEWTPGVWGAWKESFEKLRISEEPHALSFWLSAPPAESTFADILIELFGKEQDKNVRALLHTAWPRLDLEIHAGVMRKIEEMFQNPSDRDIILERLILNRKERSEQKILKRLWDHCPDLLAQELAKRQTLQAREELLNHRDKLPPSVESLLGLEPVSEPDTKEPSESPEPASPPPALGLAAVTTLLSRRGFFRNMFAGAAVPDLLPNKPSTPAKRKRVLQFMQGSWADFITAIEYRTSRPPEGRRVLEVDAAIRELEKESTKKLPAPWQGQVVGDFARDLLKALQTVSGLDRPLHRWRTFNLEVLNPAHLHAFLSPQGSLGKEYLVTTVFDIPTQLEEPYSPIERENRHVMPITWLMSLSPDDESGNFGGSWTDPADGRIYVFVHELQDKVNRIDRATTSDMTRYDPFFRKVGGAAQLALGRLESFLREWVQRRFPPKGTSLSKAQKRQLESDITRDAIEGERLNLAWLQRNVPTTLPEAFFLPRHHKDGTPIDAGQIKNAYARTGRLLEQFLTPRDRGLLLLELGRRLVHGRIKITSGYWFAEYLSALNILNWLGGSTAGQWEEGRNPERVKSMLDFIYAMPQEELQRRVRRLLGNYFKESPDSPLSDGDRAAACVLGAA